MKRKIVFLTGAGMSVESGFKTFRGQDGLWENHPVEKVATHEAWNTDPNYVTQFFNMLRQKLWKAQPNEGHQLIAALEKDNDVVVVTQNIDDLHERAGSSKVIHLHGELSKACSSLQPYNERFIVQKTEQDSDVTPGTRAADGSLLRPFIVLFGESVPMLNTAIDEVLQADVFVIIGTSLNVYPAASLIDYCKRQTPIYLIDPAAVATHRSGVIHIGKGASEGMKELCEILK